MNVLGFAGSLRKDSFNKKLLTCAAAISEQQLGTPIRIHDLGDIPLYNGDVENAGMPEAVAKFRSDIEWAEAIVICTPEYNNSMSGITKNAVDWGSRPPNRFNEKIVSVMGATPGGFGTVQAQRDLRHVMNILNAIIVPYPFVYVSKAPEAFTPDGKLASEATAKNVTQLLQRLYETTKALKK